MNRRGDRVELWFPVNLMRGDEAGLAVAVNASRSGILLASHDKLEPGEQVSLTLTIDDDGKSERVVQGRVVRVEANERDPDGLWPHRVAIEFSLEHPDVEALVERTFTRRSVPPQDK